MDTGTTESKKKINQGRNIRLARNWKGVSQESLAQNLEIGQKMLSKIERKETVEDEWLDKIAASLDVPVDFLKTFEMDEFLKNYSLNIYESPLTNNSGEYSQEIVTQQVGEQDIVNNTYPIDEIKDLYNKLLEEKDKQIALFQKRIEELQK